MQTAWTGASPVDQASTSFSYGVDTIGSSFLPKIQVDNPMLTSIWVNRAAARPRNLRELRVVYRRMA